MNKKRLISFSVWGSDPRYLDGLFKNRELADKFYPGWTVRAYYQEDMPGDFVGEMEKAGIEVMSKPFYRDPWIGLFWRFCPMFDDDGLERFIVRDTDARLSEREADAVQEWIESDYGFHLMRDHPAHNIQICGGMWGARAGLIRNFREMMEAWMKTVSGNTSNPRTRFHGVDQDFLCQKIWPLIKNDHLAHIAAHDSLKFTGKERGFRITNPCGYRVGT